MSLTAPLPSVLTTGALDIGIVPTVSELTVAQAANVLHVSEPFLLTLLDSGEIPAQKIGNRVRINADDIHAFQASHQRHHLKTVDELVEEGQLLNPNY